MTVLDSVPRQTLDLAWLDPQREGRNLELQAREARWWSLEPGDEGYDTPLHQYLGFTSLDEWRDYAISERRTR
jgi:hypothetical protein